MSIYLFLHIPPQIYTIACFGVDSDLLDSIFISFQFVHKKSFNIFDYKYNNILLYDIFLCDIRFTKPRDCIFLSDW